MAPKIRTKKPARAALTRETILDAAARVIDAVGYAQFSMRGLGAELGVEAMSVYHHFPSKAHIGDALLGRLLESVTPVDPTLPWIEKIRHQAYAYRTAILRHPGFATFALTHRMNTPEGLRYLEQLVGSVAEAGFSPEQTARVFRSLGYYLAGAMLDETAGYSLGPSSAELLTPKQQQAIAPSVVSLAPWFRSEHWERTFAFGLEPLLTHFEQMRTKLPSEEVVL